MLWNRAQKNIRVARSYVLYMHLVLACMCAASASQWMIIINQGHSRRVHDPAPSDHWSRKQADDLLLAVNGAGLLYSSPSLCPCGTGTFSTGFHLQNNGGTIKGGVMRQKKGLTPGGWSSSLYPCNFKSWRWIWRSRRTRRGWRASSWGYSTCKKTVDSLDLPLPCILQYIAMQKEILRVNHLFTRGTGVKVFWYLTRCT